MSATTRKVALLTETLSEERNEPERVLVEIRCRSCRQPLARIIERNGERFADVYIRRKDRAQTGFDWGLEHPDKPFPREEPTVTVGLELIEAPSGVVVNKRFWPYLHYFVAIGALDDEHHIWMADYRTIRDHIEQGKPNLALPLHCSRKRG